MATGLSVVFWRLRPGSSARTSLASQLADDVARTRRVNGVLVTTALSRLVVAVVGVMGRVRPDAVSPDVSVAVLIVVAPASAALNPCLLAVSVYLEKRRKRKEERLLQRLKAETMAKMANGR